MGRGPSQHRRLTIAQSSAALINLLGQLLGEDTVVELAADIDLRTAAPDHH